MKHPEMPDHFLQLLPTAGPEMNALYSHKKIFHASRKFQRFLDHIKVKLKQLLLLYVLFLLLL